MSEGPVRPAPAPLASGVRGLDWFWLIAWAVASSLWCLSAAAHLSATFDEPAYIARGLEGWRTGSHSGLLRLGTMPLPADLQTLPLYLWERWHGTAFDAARDFAQLLPWARAVTLLFWWLLLLYGWLAARDIAGVWGGRLAVALLACEPSFLGHASLATTDVAVSGCLLALVYHFRRGRAGRWGWRVGLPAVWYAATVLAKASGLVLGPLCLLVVELQRVRSEPRTGAGRWPLHGFVRDLTQIVAGGLVLVFLYCGCDWRTEPSFVAWATALPEGPFRQLMVWCAAQLRIFTNAGDALVRQIRHNIRGHGVYLLGTTRPRALWYYFPVLLTIKLSEPLLIAPLVLAAWRPRTLGNWACVTAGVLLICSLTFRVQLGVRMVLPLVAFGVVGLAGAMVNAVRSCDLPGARSLAVLAVGGAAAWSATAAIQMWPHAIPYVNSFWGGTTAGYRLVSDSNYDWGQGLWELARWQRQHADEPLDLWYFGTDPAASQLPMRVVPLHVLPIDGPEDVIDRVRGHRLAVSTTLLYGTTITPAQQRAATFLRGLQPVARTNTFLIFDFSGGEPEAPRS